MGDMAEMMMDGTLCAECGVFIDDEQEGYEGAYGYPRYCRSCGGSRDLNGQRTPQYQTRKPKRREHPK